MKYKYAKEVALGKKQIEDIPVLYRKIVSDLINENFDDLLQKIKDDKWEEIKTIRNRQEQSGLPFKESVLDYDQISVIRLSQACDGLKEAIDTGLITEENAFIEWTMQDNSVMQLSYADLKSIPLLAYNYSDGLHKKSRKLREQIKNATTIEEICNITW